MPNNDWSKKTLKERLNAARQLLSNEVKKEFLEQLRGDKPEQEYRSEVCIKPFYFFAITDYVNGVAVVAKYKIEKEAEDDGLMYHALLVQGKGVYLPNDTYPATNFYTGYSIGDDFYLSENGARFGKKRAFEKDVDKTVIIETTALHEFLTNTGYPSILNFIRKEGNKVRQAAIQKTKQKKKAEAEHMINIISELKPITKEMLIDTIVDKHLWDIKLTQIKKEGSTVVEMVRYACSCGRQFCCPIDSPEAVLCNNGDIKEFSTSVRRRRRHQNSIANIFLEYIPEADLFVWRYVRLYIDASAANDSETFRVSTLLTVVLSEKKLYCFGEDNYVQEPSCLDYFFPMSWNDEIKLIKLNEVDKYYDTSFLQYSGAKEEWNKNAQCEWSLARNGYLYTWFNNPCVEQLKKAGFSKLAKSIEVNHSLAKRVLNIRAGKATEIIGLTKPFYNFAKECDVDLDEMWNIKKLLSIFPDANVDEVNFMLSRLKHNSISSLKDIAEFNLTLKQIVEYIQQAETQQYLFHLDKTLELWRDVLRMAKALNLRLRKDIKFPTYLKPQHDKLVFFTNKLAEIQEEEAFKKILPQSLVYEYSGEETDDFIIVVPKTPQELMDEGDAQSHCVASYLNSVTKGECIVAFLRKKEKPNESYFTIEICNGEVRQLKGFSNCLCTDTESLKFVKRWMKIKKLTKASKDF